VIFPAPVALAVPAASPSPAEFTLEGVYAVAHAAARKAADPRAVLAGESSTTAEKLSAIDSIHSRLPGQTAASQRAAVSALVDASADPRQPPEVRAKALTHLGYAVPVIEDEKTRAKAVNALLSNLPSQTYRIYALRGLGPAAHDLPDALEAPVQKTLLDLLTGPVAGEERATALVALQSFLSTRDDLWERKPSLVAQLDESLLAPLEADPAAFVNDPRGCVASRQLTLSVVWTSARHRETGGNKAPVLRVHALLNRLAKIETSPTVLGWIEIYRRSGPASSTGRDGAESSDHASPGVS